MDDFYESIADEVISRFSEIDKYNTYVIGEFYSQNVIREFVKDYIDNKRIIFDARDFYVDDIINRLMELGFPCKSENNYLENAWHINKDMLYYNSNKILVKLVVKHHRSLAL